MRNDIIRKIVWLLTLIYMSLIFYLSSRSVTESRTDSARIMSMLRFVERQEDALDVENWQMMNFQTIVRKYAHVIIFAGLGMLYFVCIYGYFGRIVVTGALSLLFTAIYGATDEIHQIFSQRGAGVKDVLFDTLGGFAGILVIGIVFYIIEKNGKVKAFFNKIYDFEPKRPRLITSGGDSNDRQHENKNGKYYKGGNDGGNKLKGNN